MNYVFISIERIFRVRTSSRGRAQNCVKSSNSSADGNDNNY